MPDPVRLAEWPLLLMQTIPAADAAAPIAGGTRVLLDFAEFDAFRCSDAQPISGPNGSGWRVRYDYRPDSDILLLEGRCPQGVLTQMPTEIRVVRVERSAPADLAPQDLGMSDVATRIRREPAMREITASTKVNGARRIASVEAAKRKVRDGARYFIRRHGGFFRPQAHGYTTNLAEAGLFSSIEARSYLEVEGLSVVPLVSIRDRLESELAEATRKVASLRSLLDLVARA